MQVYETASRRRCRDVTGKNPIQVRWIDTHKQGDIIQKFRSRLVAKDFKKEADPELDTTTPPIDALRLLISLAAIGYSRRGSRRTLMVDDVARAYDNTPLRIQS